MRYLNTLKILLVSVIVFGCDSASTDIETETLEFVQGKTIFEEISGIVAVEAEHYTTQQVTIYRSWFNWKTGQTTGITPDADMNHVDKGASGGEYLEILPDTRITHNDPMERGSFTNRGGLYCILNYQIYFHHPGKYYVWVRAYSTGTEDNGLHVGIDGKWPSSGNKMQWCSGKRSWYWDSKQRTTENHCGVEKLIYLLVNKPGVHTISFSQREDGFEFDKFILEIDQNGYNRPDGVGTRERIYKK